MGCYCVKYKEIHLDTIIESKVLQIADLNLSSAVNSNNKMSSKNLNKPNDNNNTLNTQNNADNNNTKDNTNTINQTNFADSVEFRKSSFFDQLEKPKSSKNSFLEDNDFEKSMLDMINLIRKNPIFLINKIKSFMKNIKEDKNKSYYLLNKNTKINFKKGKEAFLKCCNFLTELSEKLNKNLIKLNELEFKEELKFPFPFDNPDLCNNKEYVSQNINEIQNKINNKKMIIQGFHYDLSTNNAETSLILQVVDDNNSNGKRRNIIFDERIKYVGISHGRVKDNVYCIYLLFAAEWI